MRTLLLLAATALPLVADISLNTGAMNPRSARVLISHALTTEAAWTNYDLSYDGSTLGLTRGNQTIVMIDVPTATVKAEIQTNGGSIHDTAISGDGEHYALTMDNGIVEVYSSGKKKQVGTFNTAGGFC